jgi:hypothetical protein
MANGKSKKDRQKITNGPELRPKLRRRRTKSSIKDRLLSSVRLEHIHPKQ